MSESRRSGQERRDKTGDSGSGKRSGKERRSPLSAPEQAIKRLKKINMFKDLTDNQLKQMVSICSKKTYPSQTQIYGIGDESTEMFILLKGKININFSSGVGLQNISPTGTVGEMGVFTGEPRSASVIADTDCLVLNFDKEELFTLFKKNMELWVKVQMNIIQDLSKKVRKDNQIIEELMYRVRSLEIL